MKASPGTDWWVIGYGARERSGSFCTRCRLLLRITVERHERKFSWIGAEHFRKAAKPLQKICRQGLDFGPRIAGEQHHFEKLVVGQVFRSGGDDALARPFTAIPIGMCYIAGYRGEVAGPERFVYVRQV